MASRTILYGYEIRDGQRCVRKDEADTVQKIFTMYQGGFSYQKAADTLNHEKIPYGENGSLWNKGKVKRMLEDRRYIGENGWPAVIDPQVFETVQALIQERASNQIQKTEKQKDLIASLRLNRYFQCGECETRLTANGSNGQYSGYTYLRCPLCGWTNGFPKTDLLDKIERQIKARTIAEQAEYQPSAEAIRLTNLINRSLESPDQPEETMNLILQAVSARYDCCPDPEPIQRNILTTMTPKELRTLITHITISKDSAITVHFME